MNRELQDFMFDLNGYLILKNAVDADLLARLNAEFDAFPQDLQSGDWYRGSQRRDYTPKLVWSCTTRSSLAGLLKN
jgi:ectoine hydroxylase-related dioxygenase (phytanoyl-CoA dioxygenase family)